MRNHLHFFRIQMLTLLVFCSCFAVDAQDLAFVNGSDTYDTYDQIHEKSLKSILNELELKHKIHFSYANEVVNNKFGVVKDDLINKKNIEVALDQILSPLGLKFRKVDENLFFIYQDQHKDIHKIKRNETSAATQDNFSYQVDQIRQMGVSAIYNKLIKTISGTITDAETNDPLPGVNILAKGTSTGTVTDVDGKYRLTVDDEVTTLIFSSIGYTSQEVEINGRSVIDINLAQDVQSLSEIVVIGYGTAKKSDLTGAVANVKSEELLDRQPINVTQALQGRIAGVDVYNNNAAPGFNSRVRIRGINSINSSIDPLYVVDGVIGVSPDALDPNNIESIEVLKDASATAIYGARGANGVIMVTTKRGMQGSLISYEGFGSYSVPSRSVPRLNAKEFMQVYNAAFDNAEKYDPQGFADGKYIRNNPADFPNLFDANGNPLYDTDWEAEIYQPAFSQNHHLSVQGGADKTTYSVSLGYTDQDGIMRNSDYKRYNAKFTLDNQVRDWLKIGGSVTVLKSKQTEVSDANGGLNVARMVFEALPILPIKYPDGNWGRNKDWPGMEGGENPVRITEERQRKNNRVEMLGDIYAQIDITPDLNFRSSFGYDVINRKHNFYSGRDLNALSADQNGRSDIATWFTTYWQSENYFTYNKGLFGDTHNLTALLGLSWQEWYEETTYTASENFIDDFWGWHNLGVGTNRSGVGSGDSRWALNSYFGRINYNILEKYIITLTGRIDGSSKFGANNKYAFFPSVGVAWRASEESFFNVDAISNLKLRASAGSTGNQEIDSYRSLQFLGTENVLLNGDRQTAIYRSSFGNPDLKWEVTNQLDVGLELGLFNNRIELTADYYYKRTNDLLLDAPIPWSTGLSSVTQNIGSVENKGIELTLNTINFSQGDFVWTTNINYAMNRNKVLKLGVNNDDIFPGPWFLGQTNILRVGEPIGSFWGYHRLGTWGSDEETEAAKYNLLPGDLKWEDINGDGKLDAADETIIGRAYPKGTLNLSNSFNYKNFDFSFDIRFVMGVNTVNAIKHSTEDRQAIASGLATILDAWTPENQDTYVAQIRHYNAGYSTHMDDWWVEDGSFVRGQNFVVGYSIPAATLDRIGLQKLRVYASAQNLFLITDYSGYDPEATTFGGQLTQNIEFFQYPKPRTFNVGVNLSF